MARHITRVSSNAASSQHNGDTVQAADDSEDAILRAAALSFREYGFDGTSLDRVAERLGSTKGRIYHRFESKAELFLTVQLWAIEGLLAQLSPIVEMDASATERLRAMVFKHASMIATAYGFEVAAMSRREIGLLKIGTPRQFKLLRRVFEMRDKYEDLFATVLDQGIHSGEFEPMPARLLTKPIFGAVNALLIWYDPDRKSGLTVDQLATFHADFVLRAVSRTKIPNR